MDLGIKVFGRNLRLKIYGGLGDGSFGRLFLVRREVEDKEDKRDGLSNVLDVNDLNIPFRRNIALKIYRKCDLIQDDINLEDMTSQILLEKEILQLSSEKTQQFLVNGLAYLIDDKFIYLLMEFMSGGNLMEYFISVGGCFLFSF